MAFKPRTMRRLILLGAIGCVIVLGSLGYFVVRPWQRQNKLDSMRVDGLAAAQAGDHIEAVNLLGRYLRVTPGADPEYILAHARSRLAYQARDGGHVGVAIQSYRDYLKAVPDDTEAALELLPLFNIRKQFVEAKTLANTLIDKHHENGPVVLRELIKAKKELEGDSESLGLLYAQAAEHADAEFRDVAGYIGWLTTHDRTEDAQAFLDRRLIEHNGAIADRFLSFWINDAIPYNGGPTDELLTALSAALSIDRVTGAWIQEPDSLDPSLVNLCSKLFNQYGRVDLSLLLRKTSVAINGIDDEFSISVLARREYWSREHEELLAMDFESEEHEPLPDLIAYQTLALKDMDQDDQAQEKLDILAGIQYDSRGSIWTDLLKAKDLLELEDTTEEQLEEAYLLAKKANENYDEPTLSLVMGDIEYQRGDLESARNHWDYAHEVVVNQTASWEWITPYERVIHAYTKEGRLGEVVEYIEELRIFAMRVNPSFQNIMLVFRSYAELARLGQASENVIRELLTQYEAVYSHLTPDERAYFSPAIATLYASIGLRDQARDTLVEAANATGDQQVLNELFTTDQIYQLGFAELAGIDVSQVMESSPETALSYALTEFGDMDQLNEGIAIFDRGIAASNGDKDVQYRWKLERVRYIDHVIEPIKATDDGEAAGNAARTAWDQLLEEFPNNVDLLYLFAESRALSQDLPAVDSVIERVMEKTGISGADVPARLKLARASAMVGQGDVTRSVRDEAIKIVRGVLAQDQGNINARNMLGRLYELRSSATVTNASERFTPEYGLAIEEYMKIARQLKGPKALDYYFTSVRLAIEIGENSSAREYLVEVTNAFSEDLRVQFRAATKFEILGDLQRAQGMYDVIYTESSDESLRVIAGISLAKVLIANGDRSDAQRVLGEISQEETLDGQQLFQLAALYAKNGYADEGGLVVSRGEEYGIEKAEALMIHAQYTGAYNRDQYESVLREMIENDQSNEDAWARLVKYLVKEDRVQEADEVLAEGIGMNPESKQLKLLSMISQGQVQSFADLLESGAIESEKLMEKITPRADAYVQAKSTADRQTLQSMLVTMIQDFPFEESFQKYLVSELASLDGVSPMVLVENIAPVARRFPANSFIMGIACDAFLRTGQPTKAIELATIWRSNIVGSPMSADLLIAQGYVQLERYSQASRTLQPYMFKVNQYSAEPVSAEVLFTYCKSQLLDGESPNAIADRLRNLFTDKKSYGRTIFINLAGSWVQSLDVAVSWMEEVTPDLIESEHMLAAEQWHTIMKRFDAYNPQYAQAAIDLIGDVDQVTSENLIQSNLLVKAYGILGECFEDSQERSAAYQRSISLLDQLHAIEPMNPIYLAQAGSYAQASGDWKLAQAKYRQILDMNIQSVPFVASVKNNLAVLIERNTQDRGELNEALELSQAASEAMKIGSFYGSRGWVELALEKIDEAESSFERCVEYEPDSLEGWVGLAVVRYQAGEDRWEDALSAFRQAQTLMQNQELSPYLSEKLRVFGSPNWELSDASE